MWEQPCKASRKAWQWLPWGGIVPGERSAPTPSSLLKEPSHTWVWSSINPSSQLQPRLLWAFAPQHFPPDSCRREEPCIPPLSPRTVVEPRALPSPAPALFSGSAAREAVMAASSGAAPSLSRSVCTFAAVLYSFSESMVAFDQSSGLCTKPHLSAITGFFVSLSYALCRCITISKHPQEMTKSWSI